MKKNRSFVHYLLMFSILIYAVTWLYAFWTNYQAADYQALGMGAVALLTPWLVVLLFKITHLKASDEIYLLNVIFVYFASLVGSCLGGYGLPFFDKVLHFSSGIFATLLAMMLFSWIKHTKKTNNPADTIIFYLFINTTNLAVAVLWEFYEYSMLIFFNNDCINHYTTGVHDSITDMLCAFAAGLLLTISVVRYFRHQKSNFFISLYEKFYDMNIAGKQAPFSNT